tara:strand:+ start:12970 stop:15345 length:2376 start_codon:yes stop_codon:yes gene_type:complete
VDLFNPPKTLNYHYMTHKLKTDDLTNPHIQVVWEDTPENFTQERIKRVRTYFQKKYSSTNVNVVTKVKSTEGELQSIDVSMNILDENYQRELIVKFLDNNGFKEFSDDVLKLDDSVENVISADKAEVTPFKKWYIKKIDFSNFLSFGDGQILDFDKIKGISTVESNPPNFGGKTVLTVDLLLFLFFNQTTKTSKAEEIFNRFRNKDKVTVRGEVLIDGEEYIIVREVTRKLKRNKMDYTVSTSLDFFKKLADGSLLNFTGEQRRETEDFIKKSIGSMDDFLMTILTTASNLEELIDAKPTARGQVLSRFLGLDALKLKEDTAKEMSSKFQKSMTSNLYDIVSLKSYIGEHDDLINGQKESIKDNKDKLVDVNKRIEKGQEYRDGLLKQKHTGLDDELLKVRPETLKREIEEFKSKITLTELDLKGVSVNEPSEYYHEDKHDAVKELLSEEKIKLGTMKSKIQDITEEINEFEGGLQCQYCGIELAKSDYTEKKKVELKELNVNVEGSSTQVNRLSEEEQSFVNLKKEFDLYERNKLIKEKYEIQLESLILKRDSVQDKLDRFNKDKEKFEDNKKIDETILRADMRLDELQVEKDGVNYEITNSEANIKKYEEKISDFNDLIKKIKEEEAKLKIYKIYLELFGKKGISKMIMRSMLPVINSELQRLLMDSAEFKLEVRISDKDEVEFWMIDNNTQIEKLISSGSGFERTMASLALRAVLSKVCSLPKPNIVVFDEVFGKISNDNLDMVAEFFHKIKDYFEKILIITHNPMVSQWADGIVKIEKKNNVSQVVQ